ncbi:hypothetical protein OA40_12340 [Morganella morganii]|nr:hypothetical protein OA40_12340 [Morganella morganii]KOO19748.1 hypothetical protein AC068_05325 [Morganella morganii]BEP22773.1 hypothetical protein SUGSMm_35700 [Morganella morganii subsp. sibonii]
MNTIGSAIIHAGLVAVQPSVSTGHSVSIMKSTPVTQICNTGAEFVRQDTIAPDAIKVNVKSGEINLLMLNTLYNIRAETNRPVSSQSLRPQ